MKERGDAKVAKQNTMRLGGEQDVGGCIMRLATCKVKGEEKVEAYL